MLGRAKAAAVLGAVLPALALMVPVAPRVAADAPAGTDWHQLSTTGPSARIAPYLAYDSARDRTVLFGGAETSSSYVNDTWELDGTTWTKAATSGPPPSGLGAMVYDPARGVSVIFGGGDANGTVPAATWEWNGVAWSQHATAHTPPARVWLGMTYDSVRHVVVLFGGAASGGFKFSDTWEYDGSDWRQVLTTHTPSPRYGIGLAFDPVRNRTVLFGGWTANGRVNDTWEYDGADWTPVNASNPPAPRWVHSMAYDPAMGRTVMFGGDYLATGKLGPNNETWVYDGAAWQLIATANAPSPRVMAPVAYDSAHSSLVLFGGTPEDFPQTAFGDTWALRLPVTLSTASIDFGTQPVRSTSSRSLTLTNSGSAGLGITSIAAGGDFGATDTCPRPPSTLQSNATCTIAVTFSPSSGNGPTAGTLTIMDDAGTQTVQLTGTGQWGEVNPLQSSIDLGTSPINPSGPTATAVETITIPDFPTIITAVSAGYPFAVTGFDCSLNTLLAVGTTCHASLAFQPAAFGAYSGQLRISANQANVQVVSLSGAASPLPLSLTLTASGAGVWGHSVNAQVSTNAGSGSATFNLNGRVVGSPVPLDGSGSAAAVIPLDDSTIASGSGSYSLVVTVHSTDGIHPDGSAAQSLAVAPAPETLAWNGTGLAVAGAAPKLSATVAPPTGETQFYDFSDHAVWVRFDVTSATGVTSTFYAQVANAGGAGRGSASVVGASIAAGAYSVRARLVAGSGSSVSNAYVASEELRTAYAGYPVRGGYLTGWGQPAPSTAVAFTFIAGSGRGGSLIAITPTTVANSQTGLPDDAYIVVDSTSVTSVGSVRHGATATGTATVAVYDAVTGEHISQFDTTTTFQVNIYADGSVDVNTESFTISLPPGSGINHL